jgi:hypothetical protein
MALQILLETEKAKTIELYFENITFLAKVTMNLNTF